MQLKMMKMATLTTMDLKEKMKMMIGKGNEGNWKIFNEIIGDDEILKNEEIISTPSPS